MKTLDVVSALANLHPSIFNQVREQLAQSNIRIIINDKDEEEMERAGYAGRSKWPIVVQALMKSRHATEEAEGALDQDV